MYLLKNYYVGSGTMAHGISLKVTGEKDGNGNLIYNCSVIEHLRHPRTGYIQHAYAKGETMKQAIQAAMIEYKGENDGPYE
jgi:hypothetical protein